MSYNVSYYNTVTTSVGGSGMVGLNPFLYGFDFKVLYASLFPFVRSVDHDERKNVDILKPDQRGGSSVSSRPWYTDKGLLVNVDRKSRRQKNYSFEYESTKITFEGVEALVAETDGQYIWVKSKERNILEETDTVVLDCYLVSSGEKIWSFQYDGFSEYGSHSHTPKKVGDFLVVNLGYASKKSGSYVPEMAEAYERLGFKDDIVFIDGGLLAIDIETGKEIWRAKYDYAVSNFIVVEDRLFLAYLGKVIEVDVNSGGEISRVDTGYEHAHAFADQGAIHDVGEYLAYVSTLDKGITVYDKSTLNEVQKIQIPELYSLKSFNSFYVGEENKVYATLKGDAQSLSRPSDYLLMVLTPCQQGDVPSIDIEQKPPRTVTVIEEDAEEFYRVELDAETADQLIRFAEVEIDLIAGNHGRTMWGAPAQNKKFAGRIEFQATLPEELPNSEIERAKEYLIVLREYWDKVKEDDCYGPYGGKPGTYICPNFYLNGETI